LLKVMRPELVNRFDGVIVFEPLALEDVVVITKLQLKKIGEMLGKKGMFFRFEEEAARILAQRGFDPQFGARPLRRLLQDKIEDEIANKLLAGELKRRDTVIINDRAVIEVLPAKAI
jgi:ATP-dependent Clp protease ATP-binding subunit ClpA